jgi:hypothetical protein
LPCRSPTNRVFEELQQIFPGRWLGSKRLAGEGPRQNLASGVEILDRALAIDPSQAAGRRMPVGTTDQLVLPGGLEVSPIEV